MNRTLGVAILLYVLGGAAGCGSPRTRSSETAPDVVHQQIQERLSEIAQAVSGRDVERLMRVYVTEEPLYNAVEGSVITSRDSLEAAFRRSWGRLPEGPISLRWENVHIEPLPGGHALVVAEFDWVQRDGTGIPIDSVHAAWTGLFVRSNRGWHLKAEHQSW